MGSPKPSLSDQSIALVSQPGQRSFASSAHAVAYFMKWIAGLSVLAALGVAAYPIVTAFGYTERHEIDPCRTAMKTFAAVCLAYANDHNGHLPDGFDSVQMSAMTRPGTLPYVYLGKGLASDCPETTVIAYEPLANHRYMGMHVLFGDWHVEYLPAASAQALIRSITPGKPTIWPPLGAK